MTFSQIPLGDAVLSILNLGMVEPREPNPVQAAGQVDFLTQDSAHEKDATRKGGNASAIQGAAGNLEYSAVEKVLEFGTIR